MDEDLYPRFSTDELARRRRSIVDLMGSSGVSHLVAYGAERVGSAVPWLTEWPVTTEAVLLFTPEEPPILLVQHYNHLPNARAIASDCEVDWGGPSTIARLDELLRDRVSSGQRVGVIGPLRHRDHIRLAASVGALVELDAGYQRLRLVKSPEEIGRMEVAARLSDQAISALVQKVEVGMDERHLAAIVESAYLADGGTNHIHYFAATSMDNPDKSVPWQFQSTRRLRKGDILFLSLIHI